MKKLNTKQQKAVILLAQGVKGVDIAKELNIVPQTLCEWKKSSLFMADAYSGRS